MKELFLLLLFIVGTAATLSEYHGNRRFWTVVDSNGRTKVALHILNEPVNLMFPKDKTIPQLLSDMTLYSPIGNDICQDTTNTMGFTLLFDDRNHIRGEIKMELTGFGQKVIMLLYQKCGDVEFSGHYSVRVIEGTEYSLEDESGRSCFKDGEPPFRPHGINTAKNVMELNVSPGAPGAFECQVFMILPEYMQVEDAPFPQAQINPLNSTFADKGDEYWWKKEAHEWLPSAVSFVEEDVKINILNTSKLIPLYFRIGNNSAIPSFKFAFPPSCNSFKTELYLNFKDEPGCKIGIDLTQAGFKVSTKGSPGKEIKDASKSPTLVFDEAKDLVYVKVKDPLSVQTFDTCTMAKVVSDQLVVQIALDEGGQMCDSADVTLNQRDIERTIDVLIDRAKIVEPNITIPTNGTENATIAAVVSVATTQESADAGFQWWWVVVPIGLLLIVLLAILITYLCIRPKRRNQKPKPKGLPPCSILNHDNEDQPNSPGVKTAIPAESPKKKNKKKKKDGELDESSKGSKKSKKEKRQPFKSKTSEPEKVDLYENLPPPMIQKQPQKPRLSAFQTDQIQTEPTNDPTIETGRTQVDSQRTIPGTVEKAKPRPKLKYRSMYGAGGFGQLDQPFDYHLHEGSEYEPTINFDDVESELQQFQHFWSCIESLSTPKRYAGIYVNSEVAGQNIYFMIRDCVAEESKYSAFRALSNRMLEPLKSDSDPPKKSNDGDKKYVIRTFVLSYEPLTMEIHCRGQCPLFLFNIFDCEQCSEIAERLQKNAWLNSQSTCHENWDTFVCRVKRTPMNTHQFLSYNGPGKPKNFEEVNHVMVIRGNKKPSKLRDCIRGCKYSDMSHANNFTFENDQDGDDPTLQTQIIQPSS